ncbi:hypothetical protein F4809DRAFT_659103 [Biscogniauxia mediterranea]|nr:hypothetical protein F4809DRAFT_659103 [Biscogniauxia mediterranea]
MKTPLRLSTTTVTAADAAVFFFSFSLAASRPGTARAHRLLSQTANLTLFADAACAEPVADGLVLLLAVDTCGGAAAAGDLLSYRALAVNDRPWCADGERPALNLYADAGCGGVAVASWPLLLLMPGACVAPGEGFRGMVFSCERGLEGGGIVTVTPTMTTEDGSGSAFATTTTTGGVGVVASSSTEAGTETTATESSSSSSASATAVPSRGATVSRIRSGPLLLLLFASALIIAAVAV